MSKYPRTFHCPWSPGTQNDDKIISVEDLTNFIGKDLCISEKLDGGNCMVKPDAIFARSHTGEPSHKSFHWLKQFRQNHLQYKLTQKDDYFFEYCYAVHSIEYDALPHYLFLLMIRGEALFYSQEDGNRKLSG